MPLATHSMPPSPHRRWERLEEAVVALAQLIELPKLAELNDAMTLPAPFVQSCRSLNRILAELIEEGRGLG